MARDGGKTIVDGNERVLRARLSDAKFFWDQDRKVRLEDRLPALRGIVFHAKLGTQAERVLERAQTEREQQLSKTEIVQAASREADRMVAEAEAVSRRIKAEAESYVEGKLATFEVVLQKTLAAVERGRARLGGRLEQDELSTDELDLASRAPAER